MMMMMMMIMMMMHVCKNVILLETSLVTDHLYFVHAVLIEQKFMAWVEQYHSRGH